MAGTRLTIRKLKANVGYRFSIRTPGTPERWAQFEEEMDYWWGLLTQQLVSKAATPRAYVWRHVWIVGGGALLSGVCSVGAPRAVARSCVHGPSAGLFGMTPWGWSRTHPHSTPHT
jgi:hypothetical protein